MRRTVGVIVGAATALALAGTAGATAWAMTERDRSAVVGEWHEPPAGNAPGAGGGQVIPGADAPRAVGPAGAAAVPAANAVATAPRTKPGTAAARRVTVGAVEKMTKLVGYAGSTRRETIRRPGASYIKVHFGKMLMLPGDYVTVSDPSGTESYRYDAPALLDGVLAGRVAESATGRWAMSVTGDTAVVELHRASPLAAVTAPLSRLGVGVDRVARGWTPAERKAARAQAPAGPGREESVCGGNQAVDAVCYRSTDPVAYTRSKAIARLLINGTELCTGWRVGAKNRMLTNNHCFDNSDDAYETEVWFNYQCARCGGYDVFRATKVWGDRVLATNRTYDYTVFTVENFAAVAKFGYLLFDLRRPARNEQLYVPQHPAGEPTMIAGGRGERAGNCAVVDNAYDGYARDSDVSYYCDTEGGSSGSPVLARATNRVVALHHFGGCPNSGVRADLIYSRIRNVL